MSGRQRRSAPKQSLAQKAYQEIKEQILTCQLRPGRMLLANQLAESLRMSRTPVHEALKMLVSEGLLQVIPRVGYVISPVTVNDVQEIFQLRLTLESLAAELAARNATDDDFKAFRKMEERARNAPASISNEDPKSLRESLKENREFHLMVAGLSGNRRLVQIIDGMLDESQRLLTFDRRAHLRMGGAHQKVLEALRNRDPEAARAAMRQHILATQKRIVDSLLPEDTLHPADETSRVDG